MSISRALLLFVSVLLIAGCTTRPNWYHPEDGSSPTNNLGLELDLTDHEESQYARYRVEPDGVITFWGGGNAVFDRVTWRGSINDGEGRSIDQLVRDGNWFETPPTGDRMGNQTWIITVIEPGRRRDFTVHGHAMRVDELWSILQSASSRRFSHVIDALPKPDIESLHRETTPSGQEDQP